MPLLLPKWQPRVPFGVSVRRQYSIPITAPVRQIAKVPEMIARGPSLAISNRRSGTMVPNLVTMIPRLPMLTNPDRA